MPAYPHIDRYHDELSQLIEFDGLDNEENIRLAFQNCLVAYCADRSERLVLVLKLRSDSSNKPDGTTRESLRMTPGLWDAKDAHDDLPEIEDFRQTRRHSTGDLFDVSENLLEAIAGTRQNVAIDQYGDPRYTYRRKILRVIRGSAC